MARWIRLLLVSISMFLGLGIINTRGNPLVEVGVNPTDSQVIVTQTVEIAVEVVEVTDLYGVDLTLTYDSNALEIVDSDLRKPGVQVVVGSFLDPGFVLNQADNTAGILRFAMTQLNPSEPKSGSGTLVEITFRGKKTGLVSPLTLESVQLATRDGVEIPSTPTSGTLEVIGQVIYLPYVTNNYPSH